MGEQNGEPPVGLVVALFLADKLPAGKVLQAEEAVSHFAFDDQFGIAGFLSEANAAGKLDDAFSLLESEHYEKTPLRGNSYFRRIYREIGLKPPLSRE